MNSFLLITKPDIDLVLMAFAIFLLLPLYILANAFIMSARQQLKGRSKSKALVLLPLAFLFVPDAFGGPALQGESIYQASRYLTLALMAIIAVEFILILFFASRVLHLVKPPVEPGSNRARGFALWKWIAAKWQSANFVAPEKEVELDLNHEYDGIRELDNVIPPWFTAAFILSIIFAGVYLYRYHIAKSAPMQLEEYAMANYQAAIEHEAYLSTQLNSIDESNVTLLVGADLEAGRQVFIAKCAVCHKPDGGGLVGPNLTDDYWIHGGSLKDIFKTIKYGVPDKGMISWKDQVSPLEIAQVSSFIQTLHGTNPPDAKAKQGDLYLPAESAAHDSLTQQAMADSIPARQ